MIEIPALDRESAIGERRQGRVQRAHEEVARRQRDDDQGCEEDKRTDDQPASYAPCIRIGSGRLAALIGNRSGDQSLELGVEPVLDVRPEHRGRLGFVTLLIKQGIDSFESITQTYLL